jgi:hypothetical protein
MKSDIVFSKNIKNNIKTRASESYWRWAPKSENRFSRIRVSCLVRTGFHLMKTGFIKLFRSPELLLS